MVLPDLKISKGDIEYKNVDYAYPKNQGACYKKYKYFNRRQYHCCPSWS